MLGWELPPHNSGGLGVACLQLCKTLSDKGADITFVVPYTAKHDLDFMKVVSAKIANVSAITGVYDSVNYCEESELAGNVFEIQDKYVSAIESIVEAHDFNVIHAHDWLTFRAGLRARELSGKPLILHVHSVESDRAGNNSGNPLVHEIESLSMHLADQVVAVSEHTRQKIINEYGIPPSKVLVAHNSIDTSAMLSLDPHNSYEYITRLQALGYKVVVNIGRITIQKGLTHLLIAAQGVIQHQPKTIFMIVGSGDQQHELIRLSAELGISQNVLFTGFQRGKKWRDAFGVADLFVMPSVSEPFGLTPLEAIVYDTPSLISKQSGVAEVLKNCLKTDFWDTDKMTNDIVATLRHDSLRDELRHNAQKELAHLSWDKAAHTLMNTYRQHHEAEAVV